MIEEKHIKGSDRQCNVVILRMYSIVENIFRIHLRHVKRFKRCIITEFQRKVDFQNHPFGWVRFENRFLKLSNINDATVN